VLHLVDDLVVTQALPVQDVPDGAQGGDDAVRHRIAEAIATRSVRPVFQPIVHCDSGTVVGVEALARFSTQPSPATWFADAARVGLGPALEVAAAAAALEELDALPRGAYLSINASVVTTATPAFIDLLTSAGADRVVVELTLRAGHASLDDIVGAVERLTSIGGRVALDDVGGALLAVHDVVGVSPDIVKLDHALVHALGDPAARVIAEGVIAAAAALGSFTIAKGVETTAQLDAVRELGVDAVQGNLIGPPAPAQDLAVALSPSPR
jgi:EAL domain-containing protein (putative c-di-GMP-specific phosphodiesterase class I)